MTSIHIPFTIYQSAICTFDQLHLAIMVDAGKAAHSYSKIVATVLLPKFKGTFLSMTVVRPAKMAAAWPFTLD